MKKKGRGSRKKIEKMTTFEQLWGEKERGNTKTKKNQEEKKRKRLKNKKNLWIFHFFQIKNLLEKR